MGRGSDVRSNVQDEIIRLSRILGIDLNEVSLGSLSQPPNKYSLEQVLDDLRTIIVHASVLRFDRDCSFEAQKRAEERYCFALRRYDDDLRRVIAENAFLEYENNQLFSRLNGNTLDQ